MRLGPEHARGWRQAIEIEGLRYVVESRHTTRRRVARGHEIARQVMTGRPVGMVDEPVHAWVVYGPGMQAMPIRETSPGRFCVGADRNVHAGLLAAAEAHIRHKLEIRARGKAASAGPSEDAESAPQP